MVVYSPSEFAKALIFAAPKAIKQAWNEEKTTIDKKWQNKGIKNSKILPPDGLPLKIKYRISDSKDIKTLWALKLTMESCEKYKK